MQLIVRPEVFALFPGLRIAVAVADGLDNGQERPSVATLWRAAWDGARAASVYGNAQSHPRVRPWRERLRVAGAPPKDFPSSIEALLRRALKGGEPFTINPLVDFYNAVSLEHTVPAGGFDLGQVRGPIELRLTGQGDSFTALGEETAVPVPPGEVAYADGRDILTRHIVWRQSRLGLIGPATREVMLVSEVLGEVGGEVVDEVLESFRAGLFAHFGVTARTFVVDETTPAVAWL